MLNANSTKVPSTKGIRAAGSVVAEILNNNESARTLLNVLFAAQENGLPVEQEQLLQVNDHLVAANRILYGQKGLLEHLASVNSAIETAHKLVLEARFSGKGVINGVA